MPDPHFESDLLQRIRAGDPDAVILATRTLLFRLNRRGRQLDPAIREDFVAEGVLLIVTLFHSAEGRLRLFRISNLEGWFQTALARILIRVRLRRRNTEPIDEEVPSPAKGPLALAERAEILVILENLFRRLDAGDRELLRRRHLEGESCSALAGSESAREIKQVLRAQERAEREVRRMAALLFPRTWPELSL